ncbi:Armadillo-type fold,Protein phosphatase 2A, regulatory B subunit, B56,Armadillo-like helical [Cinara cedri]|uniref:Armadillo-type fold,Protein phosphatase 2A, regulatory B subunit, B56,Armadillo-like helical n=1 Tax=Cinara cedri TaxID=506608 RepID=A0A5E4LXA7_9HEMI|nr:Armadillo-type fold,Protein phosphatase 2A, regulatory B subunit, B56,Armadillo-like helical [Cinara cedri]
MNNSPRTQNINRFVVHLVKSCIPYLSVSDSQMEKKCKDLDLLHTIWDKDTSEVYTAKVYAAVTKMFASNVFRPLPPSSYTLAAENEAIVAVAASIGMPPVMPKPDYDMMASAAEFTQTAITYQAFQSFVDRTEFDAEVASQFFDRRFVNGLAHRLNSGDSYERQTVRDTMARMWYACPFIHEHMLDAVVAELADFAYGYVPRHNGIDDLLHFLANNVVYEDVCQLPILKLCRVLTHLLKHPFLIAFKSNLIECVRVLDRTQKELIPHMLIFITKLWSFQNLKTIVLLRAMSDLYNVCDTDKWISLQLQIVGPLSKLFCNDDFQLADESMNFWNRILHENMKFWQSKQDDVRIVVNALKKVKRIHWNLDCVNIASSLLDFMVAKHVIKDNYMEDSEEMFQEGIRSGVNYDYTYKSIQKLVSPKISSTLPSSTDMPTTEL